MSRKSVKIGDPLFKGMRISDSAARKNEGGLPGLIFVYFYCLVTSLVVLWICSRSSPWYPFNNWDDANSYFTVGKSIWRGMVPYRDLFDQKGWLLYFIYSLGYLMDHTGFRGVFVLEILSFAFHLMAQYMILALYMKKRTAYVLLPVLAAIVTSSRCFYWGGSAEEFMLPFLSWGLYILMRYARSGFPEMIKRKDVLMCGILAGAVFNIKFNSLGLFIAFIVILTITTMLSKKGGYTIPGRIVSVIERWFIFLLGMIITTLPGAAWFIYKGAVRDWLHVYLYLNIFVYSEKLTFAGRMAAIFDILKGHFLSNKVVFIPVAVAFLAGVIYLLLALIWRDLNPFNKEDVTDNVVLEILGFIFSGMMLALGIFFGGVSLTYYPLPLTIYAVGGAIFLGRLIQPLLERGEIVALFLIVSLAGSVVISYSCSMNVPYHDYEKKDLWMYVFRDRIMESGYEDPTLINMNCFDAGLYTVCDIFPDCRFFQTQTIRLDEVEQTQVEYIKSGKADFLLSRDGPEERAGDLYSLLDVITQDIAGVEHTYYLYERVSNE